MADRRVVFGAVTVPARASARRPRFSVARAVPATARVWTFVAVLAALASLVYLEFVRELPAPGGSVVLPLWVMAAAFYLIEIKVVHLHFRRGAHSFSLSEVPLVIGLFFAAPSDVVLAHAVAGGAALLIHRRLPAVKLAFNVATFALGTGSAVAIFNVLTPGTGFGPVECAAAILAVLSSNFLGMLSVSTVISLSEGRSRYSRMRQVALISTTVAVTNVTLALLGVALVIADARAIWLLLIPLATVFIGYRSYLSEYQRHEMMQLLYESSRIIQRSPEVDSALAALLDHTRAMFHAERAEIRIYAQGEGAEPLGTAVGPDGEAELMVPRDAGETEWIRQRLANEGRAFIVPTNVVTEDVPKTLLGSMVAPLSNDSGAIGVMLAAKAPGTVSRFTDADLQLFETVANHAAVALENGQLERSLAQLSSLKEELRFQAYHDPLTGLANRTLFVEQLGRHLSDRADQLPVVLFVDVDDFKMVNDTSGHASGDALLVEIAKRLRECVRTGDVVARLGGDEFGILLADDPRLYRASTAADRIIRALDAPFMIGGKEVRIGASIGIAAGNGSDGLPQELLRNADVAMYAAKARGKGQVAVFESGMHAAMLERHDLGAALHRAVSHDEFVLRFQPIISVDDGRVVGAEALIRWRHPSRGVIAPADFISVAEESDVILPIGRWALLEACRRALDWGGGGEDGPWVSVNLSARQVHHPSFVDDVTAALVESGLPANRLVLEVTETLVMEDRDATVAKLAALRSRGVRIAIDDFGTGYSSLSYLRQFPADMIKVPRDFVDVTDEAGWDFAHAIISLGQRLGLEVIAEGVERRDQAERLRLMGCEFAQGYLFGRPLDAGAIRSHMAGVGQERPLLPEALIARGDAFREAATA